MNHEHDATEPEQAPETYHWPEIASEQMASFFASAARFFRAQPWSVMPESRGPLGVQIPGLQPEQAVVSVMGALGDAFGAMVFDNAEDLEAYLDALDNAGPDGPEELPPHLALYFEPGHDVPAELRREVGQAGWEVEARQYPWARAVSRELDARTPDAQQLTRLQAVLEALATRAQDQTCATKSRLPAVVAMTVRTHAGEQPVVLSDPHDAQRMLDALHAPFDVELSIGDDDDVDALDARLDGYCDALLARFEASAERATLPPNPPTLVPFLLDATFDACDGGVTHLSADLMRTFLFELMPRHAVVDPSTAAACVKELRAFLEFLRRELNVHAADPCLSVLDHRVVPNLRKALANRSLWSTDKRDSMVALQQHRR